MADTFGAPKEEKPKAEIKPEAKPARKRIIVVDESRDRVIQVLHSTVIFRPGQVLDNEHLIRLAQEHGILTRER